MTILYLLQAMALVIVCLACFRSLSMDVARVRDLLEGVADLVGAIDAAKAANSIDHAAELERLKTELQALRDQMDGERDQLPLPLREAPAPASRPECRVQGR